MDGTTDRIKVIKVNGPFIPPRIVENRDDFKMWDVTLLYPDGETETISVPVSLDDNQYDVARIVLEEYCDCDCEKRNPQR